MENASKALIIAGAILVSILLISIGVLVINAINPMTDQTQRASEGYAIQTFNAQFTGYEGTNVSASQVRALYSAMNSSNGVNPDHKVTVPTTAVQANKTYTVTLTYDVDTGYVNGATVTINNP